MKKNDKTIILLIMVFVFCILTWIIAGGSYTNGEFASAGITRAGIFDYFLMFYYSFYYKASTIFYIFSIGAFYGVVSQTKAYRKLISNTSKLIAGKESIAMLIITFIMSAYASLTNDILSLLFVTPFIITIFLRRGCDRLTAISAAFGGMFIGMFGQTFGTYAYNYILTGTGISVTSGMWVKIVLLVFAYGLYNLFAILHMNSRIRNAEYVKFDMFPIKKLDETNVNRYERTRVWPTLILFGLSLIVVILAYIGWEDSFGVTIFSKALESIQNFTVSDVTIFSSFLGSFTAFGNWDVLGITFVLLITGIIMVIADRMSISVTLTYAGNGIKKISKVVFIYVLIQAVFVCYYYFPWPVTVFNKFVSEKFNVFALLLGNIINGTLASDFEYATYMINSVLSVTYADYVTEASLLTRFSYSVVNLLAPTSSVLMIALAYLNVPYKKWLGYIWKYALLMIVIGLVLISIMAYV